MMHPLDIGFNRVPSQWFWNNWQGFKPRYCGYVVVEPANKGTSLRFRVPWEHFVQPGDQITPDPSVKHLLPAPPLVALSNA